ncbi:MAG: hypothetical protein HY655_05380 [Acidobacteria bacterium]|nr:hypothetical protein [Acidobacteriota bacterium]
MSLDDTLRQAFETLSDRLRAQLQTAADEIAAAVEAERDEMRASLEERSGPKPAFDETAGAEAGLGDAAALSSEDVREESMLEEIRSIGAARSLTEVLDTLASGAARETSRAGILLVRGLHLRGWRFVGFPPRFDAADTIDLPVGEAGAIADAVRDKVGVSGNSAAPEFAELPAGRQYLAVPIVMSDQVVAVLYADEGAEAVTLSPEPGTLNPEPSTLNPEPLRGWPNRVEILARFAARCLEAITAFNAARMLQERPAPGGPAAGVADDRADIGDPSDADAAARRYARLLVSEIKLYHEPEVLAGRRQRDLATRLSAEIARARLLYQQRVPPHVGERTDYFRAELVRTLADGDASLLEVRT